MLISLVLVPVLLFSILVLIVYWKQDAIVQMLLQNANKDFKGRIEIRDSHISMFENFPYISIDLEDLKIFEDKSPHSKPIVSIKDAYIGFNVWTIMKGDMEIKKIKFKKGHIDLVQHVDGSFNVANALAGTTQTVEDPNKEFHLDLKEVQLEDIDLTKLNEANQLTVEAYITEADSRFKTSPQHVLATLDAKFMLNIISGKDTTFIRHKHFEVDTKIDFTKGTDIMTIQPTEVKLEGAKFNMGGTIDFLNDVFLDLKFSGSKPNFDLFIAMAPEELIPTLKKYENQGRIFFETTVKGKSINGNVPLVNARFGCKNAFFNNYTVNTRLDALNFSGTFTNGEKRNLSTMELNLKDFSARPEAGRFSGNLSIKNFEAPDINLQLVSDFQLNFLAKFFELEGLKDLHGKIALTMNFKDIIDLEHPERSIERLNESYFTQLKVENLRFSANKHKVPVKDLDLYAEVNGHEAVIKQCNMLIGRSDISMTGTISDLPAIIHHTAIPVTSKLKIKSKFLDLYELTGSDPQTSVNEQIENLSLKLDFESSAKAITESPNLPLGEFFIEDLYAKLKHYPHTFHDFHADVFVDEEDFRVVDFKGMIDKSDFFFSGKLKKYDLWFAQHPAGDTRVEFNLTSNLLQLHDIFSYKGENYVPEDYRHEEFKNLKVHGYTDLHFKDGLRSIDLRMDKFDAKMKVHPMRFENFKGRVHYESEHLVVEDFSGRLGKSDFHTTLHYYLGKDEAVRKRDNYFKLTSSRLDFDELFSYHPLPNKKGEQSHVDHDAGFNLYDLPFTNMSFDIKVDHLNYHKYLLHNASAKWRTTPKHYVYIDHMHLDAAGGSFDIGGYFNGSDPHKIYFSPDMKLKNVDLDKLMLKFDNFGQDHIVAENLHGKFTGHITGKIHMHTDLVPKIDDSEIHIDMQVLNGKLENYALLESMSDYFSDKNLKKVLFDTLANHIDMTNGVLTIPNMTINSSLGFMQVSGKQDAQMNMEYYVRVPWKMVTQVASSKLFGKKTEEVDPDQEDAIQYADPEKKVRYLNIKITGNTENYKISLGKDKGGKKKIG